MTDEELRKQLYSIRRYDIELCGEYDNCEPLIPHPDGDYILFSDCQAITEKLLQEVKRLRLEVAEFKQEGNGERRMNE